ncbi:MAG: fatty acid desaturase [Planctomycetota bacterium]
MTEAHATPPARGGIQWRDLDWSVITAIGGIHVVALLAVLPMFFSWSGLILFAVLGYFTIAWGIGLCYHRLLTHRSFKTPKWFEYALTVLACINWQGGPVSWVGTHRLHHKHSDHDHDPHSPQHGFTWAHITWTLHKRIEGIDGKSAAKDLQRDRVLKLLDDWHGVPQFVLAALLFGIGTLVGGWALGVSWVVWGVALRTVVVFHATWFVNSASHTWGYQNYDDTGEHSTNLAWVALLTFGEGWHNNHHAHPRSASHGLTWWEIDMTYWTICALSWVGLASDIKLVEPEKMPAAVKAQKAAEAKAAEAAKAEVVAESKHHPTWAETAERVSEVASEAASRASEAATRASEAASEAAGRVSEAASEAAGRVSEAATEAAERVSEAASEAAARASEALHRGRVAPSS